MLREGERVLHNCSSHWLIHLKIPFIYIFSIVVPFLVILLFLYTGVITEDLTRQYIWFFYSSYSLVMTISFFLQNVNFELGGCIITNQRVLRFGYKGLSQFIERELLPNKIEDVKVVKRGFLPLFFDAADVRIHTSSNEVEILKNVIDSKKVQKVFSELLSSYGKGQKKADFESDGKKQDDWIDDALGESKGEVFDMEDHRDDMIDEIGDVFRKRDDS